MEGRGGYKKQKEVMHSNFGGNYNIENVSTIVKDEPDGNYRGGNPNAVVLPHGLHYLKMPQRQSYYHFLAENSSFLHKSGTADVSEAIPRPVITSSCFGQGFSEILTGPSYNNSGMAPGSSSAYSMPDTFAWNLGMQPLMTHESNPEASSNVDELYNFFPNVRSAELINTDNQFGNSQHQSHSQSSWSHSSREDVVKSSHVSPKIRVSESVIVPESKKAAQRRRAFTTDKQRKIRINERVKALQELLPYSVTGSQTAIMDDVIEYIKYLQHQMKELTQSRLGGEPNFGPLFYVEGHGHYIVLEQMMKEPLEDMVGSLMELNPSAAAKLLESKGLCFDSFI